MNDALLIINAGSSSIKFEIYDVDPEGELSSAASGQVEGIGTQPRLLAKGKKGEVLADQQWDDADTVNRDILLTHLLNWIRTAFGEKQLRAVGHRIVFGGTRYQAPVRVTDEVMANLADYIPLFPLHQPANLAPLREIAAVAPELPQVACFDTAFHRTIPRLAQLYGLPRTLVDEGIRGYGFHGLSYEYIAAELPKLDPRAARGRTIVAHLGSGASMAALVDGKSIACTLGFSTLDGLIMGTRSGRLDPGILLYLMQRKAMDAKAIEQLLYHESGLLGVSGISNDMRDLRASDSPHAKEAIDLFVYRAARELGSLAAAAGGLDALVFTAGIGENDPDVRAGICAGAAWLGVRLDDTANRNGAAQINARDSKVAVWVIATDEELMIARHTWRLVAEG